MSRTYAKKRPTKELIMQTGLDLFLKEGYKAATCTRIAKILQISPGNMTFHFPTKEHLLTELTRDMASFQWQSIKEAHQEGDSYLLAYCMEVAAMASYVNQSDTARELLHATYTHPMSLAVIRENDMKRAPTIFGVYCPDYQEADYRCIQNIVSGIEFAVISTEVSDTVTIEHIIEWALECIMSLYRVPEDIRRQKIRKALSRDYKHEGELILKSFTDYVNDVNAQAVQEARKSKQ